MSEPDEDDETPLVMERFRRFGWLGLVLAPLLVVTLAQTVVSRTWAIVIFLGGMFALQALRSRDEP